MKQKELKFDIEKINGMKTKLNETAVEMEDYKQRILENLNKLKEDWDTAAGKKFMSTVNTDWTVDVDRYIQIIGAVEQLLSEAAKQYAIVEDEIDKLKFY